MDVVLLFLESVGGSLLSLRRRLSRLDSLLSLLPDLVLLLLAGLQQETDEVRVVVHGEVGQPGA